MRQHVLYSCHWTSRCTSRRHSSRCAAYQSVNESPIQTVHSVLWSSSIVYIWHCYSSYISTRPCPPTFGEKRRLQHSTCTLWYLEQSASSAERHCCCLHLQASLKVWTLLSSLRRFNDCFNRCWSLRLFALLIDVIFSLCVVFIFNLFLVSLGLYVDLHCQAPPSMFCRGRYRNSVDWLIDWLIETKNTCRWPI